MNKRLLEAQMKLHGDTGGSLAKFLGIARSTLSMKMSDSRDAQFVQKEISMIRDRYKLSDEDVVNIFFSRD